MNKEKKLYIEALRILACFFVIFNHTDNRGFFLFSLYSETTIQYWIYSFLSIFCKFSVPLFFAISGALLIPKEETIKKTYTKRILRIALVLLLISMVYYLWYSIDNLSLLSLRDFFITLFTSDHSYHLWYLYEFISFLIGLPIIRVLARNMRNKHFAYLIVIVILFNSIKPVLEYILWQGDQTLNWSLYITWMTDTILVYPCIGFYIDNKSEINKYSKKKIILLWVINIICIVLSSVLTLYRARVTGICNKYVSQEFHSTFVIINVITLLVSFRFLFSKIILPNWMEKTIISVGRSVFGIYLIHLLVMQVVDSFNLYENLVIPFSTNMMLAGLLYTLIVFVISYIITLVLRKIPFIKKLI